jgi:hypothetical protein
VTRRKKVLPPKKRICRIQAPERGSNRARWVTTSRVLDYESHRLWCQTRLARRTTRLIAGTNGITPKKNHKSVKPSLPRYILVPSHLTERYGRLKWARNQPLVVGKMEVTVTPHQGSNSKFLKEQVACR